MNFIAKYKEIKPQFAARDARHADVMAVRRGDISEVLPGFFPKDLAKPVTANMVDVASRDLGEMLGRVPQLSCQPDRFNSDEAKRFADRRTKIAVGYVEASRLSSQLPSGADGFFMYGALPLIVEPDFESNSPAIFVDNPVGTYYLKDRRGRTLCYYKRWHETVGSLAAKFPEAAHLLRNKGNFYERAKDSDTLEVVKYYGPDQIAIFCPEKRDAILSTVHNPMGRTPVFIAERTRWDSEVRGQFDEMIWVQLIRARLALYAVELADEALNAPLAVPLDLNEFPMGPRALLRTNNPRDIRRVPLEVPAAAFQENAILAGEERIAARYPEAMTGNIDASVITGQGINALNATVNTQIEVAQNILKQAIEDALSFCFEMDQTLWPDMEKTTQGQADGAPFTEKYIPSKHIKGDFSVKATYGFASGMDANRALVWALQLRGAGAMSLDTLMRLMGDSRGINPTQEMERMRVEALQEALMAGMQGLGASFPEIAAQGGDPTDVLRRVATTIQEVQKGKPAHEAIIKAFEPTKEEQAAAQQAAQDPLAALMPGAAPGAPAGDGARPDLQMMLAGLTQGGEPNLQANISRMIPTAA